MATQLVKGSENGGSVAEVYRGYETCKEKVLEFLQEKGLPKGHSSSAIHRGMWVCERHWFCLGKRKKKMEYKYKTTGVVASYAAETTCFVEKRKMKKISGVKVRELLVWLPLSELSIQDSDSHHIYCKTAVGVGKSIPISLCEEEYDKYMSNIDVTPPAAP